MRFILATLFLAGALLLPHVLLKPTPAEQALEYVCAAKQLDCSTISPPRVRYAELLYLHGDYGYFWYEHSQNTVWLDVQFEDDPLAAMSMAVLIHETTHYVDRIIQPDIESCETESHAFALGNQYLLQNGHAELADWKWYLNYGCPAPEES